MIRRYFDKVAETLRPDHSIPVAPVVLLADHASNHIPAEMASLGLDPAHIEDHIAYDLGTDDLTRAVAARLNGYAVLARFSRLILDANRHPEHPGIVPVTSDGILIPGNQGLSVADVAERMQTLHDGYHADCAAVTAVAEGRFRTPLLVGVHSFTPQLKQGCPARPWQVGILYNDDTETADFFIRHLPTAGLVTGDNEPYSGKALFYTLDRHGRDRGLPHVGIEVRQDELMTRAAVARYADILADICLKWIETRDWTMT